MQSQRAVKPPPRDGVGPSTVVLPSTPSPAWPNVLDFLVARFAQVDAEGWRRRMQQGDVVDAQGAAISPDAPFCPGLRVHYYRDVPDEAPIPFFEDVLYQDAHIVVADKPHFLPVTPSGKYLRETLLTRLKARLRLPELSPVHRIDRDTAGLVLFTVQASERDAYQALFRQRAVHKVYECIAPWKPSLPWPFRRESHIRPSAHFMQQTEGVGPINAITTITPLNTDTEGRLARYRLEPLTGQRHQLRVHMHALGLPILNDGIYPVLTPEGADYARPLQLLAKSLEFEDPMTGAPRRFASQRALLELGTDNHNDVAPISGRIADSTQTNGQCPRA